jgi:hypothetical protein
MKSFSRAYGFLKRRLRSRHREEAIGPPSAVAWAVIHPKVCFGSRNIVTRALGDVKLWSNLGDRDEGFPAAVGVSNFPF